jgi:DNA-directed RNA polymerase subunit H
VVKERKPRSATASSSKPKRKPEAEERPQLTKTKERKEVGKKKGRKSTSKTDISKKETDVLPSEQQHGKNRAKLEDKGEGESTEVFKRLEHFFVPKHEIMTEAEKESVLRRYNATPGQFPFILSTDPVAKEIGAKPGDMIMVTRSSETAGETKYYRYVVEA